MEGSRKWERELNGVLADLCNRYPTGPTAKKTVLVVRHAESLSNVARARARAGSYTAVVGLCCGGFDSPLSSGGSRQLLDVRRVAQRVRTDLQAVLFSPLQRAKQTALELFGDEVGVSSYIAPEGKLWQPMRALKEKRPKEYAQKYLTCSSSILEGRVHVFINFLKQMPLERFAIVGHSKFLRRLFKTLGVVMKPGNAHMYEAELQVTAEGDLHCQRFDLIAAPFSPQNNQRFPADVPIVDGDDEDNTIQIERLPLASFETQPYNSTNTE